MRIASKHAGLLLIAYNDPAQWVAHVTYLDASGNVTERTVSPIEYLTNERIRVYCLGREGIRTFRLSSILRVRLRLSADVLPPEGILAVVSHHNRLRRADKSTETDGHDSRQPHAVGHEVASSTDNDGD